MFQVLDNGKPADSSEYPSLKGHGWNNSIFQFFEAAEAYAMLWLGKYSACAPDVPDKKIDYTGCGDTIEIKSLQGIQNDTI